MNVRTGVGVIVSRYIIIEFLKWLALSFSFFFAAFFVNNILLFAKDTLAAHAPLSKVLQLLFYTFPTILSYSLPFSVLLATIVTMVQLNANYELLAIQASGISLTHCYLPIMLFSILLTGLSFLINDYLLPRSSVQFIRLYQEILFSTPGLELEPYSIRKYENNLIVTQQIDGTVLFNPLIIQSDPDDNQRRIITGASAQLEVDENGGVLSLIVDQVQGHSHNADNLAEHDYFIADSLSYNVLLFALNTALRPATAREMNIITVRQYLDAERERVEGEMFVWNRGYDNARLELAHIYLDDIYLAASPSPPPLSQSDSTIEGTIQAQYNNVTVQKDDIFLDQEYRIYQTEYYRKFSLPLACLFLTLLAFPIGATLRHANWSVGFGIGLLISVVFWCLLIGGQVVSNQRPRASPFFIMFLPNIVMIVGGVVVMLVRRVKLR